MALEKLVSYLTEAKCVDGNYFIINTNCCWWVWAQERCMVKSFNHATMETIMVKVPIHRTAETLMSLTVEGYETEVFRVKKCRDGIGYLVSFKIR